MERAATHGGEHGDYHAQRRQASSHVGTGDCTTLSLRCDSIADLLLIYGAMFAEMSVVLYL